MTTTDATLSDPASILLQHVGNEAVHAAVGLLAGHRKGFWLRELLDRDGALASAVTRDDQGRPWVEWDTVGELIDRGLPQSTSEVAVLAVAASIGSTRYRVNLWQAVRAVSDRDMKAILATLSKGW
ncbi:hypothetical protein [Embleya hyalina]|uniref:Uncharacterized protein n=1 Tax=Embleya hyalina TaxID=516124 RepID=A0A401Z3V3_9ACTN|nr:hypothetical protein [Embleya hyalina]GCE01529.1 hypothetical protein EHYA_09295 [Embleya hyalina]